MLTVVVFILIDNWELACNTISAGSIPEVISFLEKANFKKDFSYEEGRDMFAFYLYKNGDILYQITVKDIKTLLEELRTHNG